VEVPSVEAEVKCELDWSRAGSLERARELGIEVEVECEVEKKSTPAKSPMATDVFKLLLIGEASVGKSCLRLRYAADEYTGEYMSTIGVDFSTRTVEIEGKVIKLQIWELAGQERFRPDGGWEEFGSDKHGILVVYDVTEQDTFHAVERWFSEIERFAGPDHVKTILLGNKCDLVSKKQVDYSMAKEFADQHGVPFYEVSAKDNQNVEQVFLDLARAIKKKMDPKQIQAEQKSTPAESLRMLPELEEDIERIRGLQQR